MLFLIEYDRTQGSIVTLQTFEDSEAREAESTRLKKELELNRTGIEREVVILQAQNEEALKRTHRRYFESLEEMAAS